jgi:hypothetical protein
MLKIPAQNGTKFSQTLSFYYFLLYDDFTSLKVHYKKTSFSFILDDNIYYYIHIKTRITSINFFFYKISIFNIHDDKNIHFSI